MNPKTPKKDTKAVEDNSAAQKTPITARRFRVVKVESTDRPRTTKKPSKDSYFMF